MRIFLLGDGDDARGFRLLGIRSERPRTGTELEAALARLTAEGDVGLVLLAADIAKLAPETVENARARPDGPAVLVLPGPSP